MAPISLSVVRTTSNLHAACPGRTQLLTKHTQGRTARAARDLIVRAGERQPWDFGRFVSTVTYFNNPAEVIQNIVKSMLGQGSAAEQQESAIITLIAPSQASSTTNKQPVVMVTGATGGVGRRVVALLLSKGLRVRALARDGDKARSLLGGLRAAAGGSLELVVADITQRPTLLPEFFRGVRALVSCTAVKVQPKEGDADRSKYFQGIKFYDPMVVGDTPETVELRGMVNVLDAVKEQLGSSDGKVVWAADGSGVATSWGSLDDVVMGGASSSGFFVQQGAGEDGGPAGVFAGNITSANNGGFASVRTRNLDPPLDLQAYAGLELRIKGDGQRYKLIIRCDPGWDSVGHTLSFPTQPGWQTVRLSFSEFLPVFRAKTMRNADPINPQSIYSIQLMLSKFESDGALNDTFREGSFELPSCASVTRPGRPGINVDEEPPAVRMNEMLGGILDFKLAAEDELRGSGVPFAIVRPVALTEEPGGMPLKFDQGDTLRGKVSREDVAELCVALLDQPAAVNTTFEVGSTVPFSQPWTVDVANPPPPRDWTAVIQGAGLKQRVTGKTVDGRYLGKDPEPERSKQLANKA
ncbi:putative complex I intermediate-associated protein 30 [Chlorella vulgaris]